MLVASGSPVRSGADLNGLILASAAINDINALAMMAWIDKTGGDSKTVKWIEIPNSAAGAALAEHRIAATMLQEPQLTAEIQTGRVRVLAPAYSAINPHMTPGVYFAQSDWAKKNPAAVATFMRVTYASAAYCNEHHAATAQMMSEVTKIPLDVITRMSRNTSATNTDPSYLQTVIDVAAKYKTIPSWFNAKDAYFTG
jgi:NitT/TauT family transport system substrate-binding protein